VIDLHLHTTASDGRSSPTALVEEAAAAGVTTIGVTAHDTLAGIPEVRAAARDRGVAVVAGIEITAVHDSRDVHVLGYFLDPAHAELGEFLTRMRGERRRRAAEIVAILERLGAPVDLSAIEAERGRGGKSLGRPLIAAALVAAGHVESIADAFERYLGDGRPAFVPRAGAVPAQVVEIIARAGGLSSLAHPGKLGLDPLVEGLAAAGLDAIEVYHPDHDEAAVDRYRHLADRYSLLVTGGSDYHGPGSGREGGLGRVGLPAPDYARLVARAPAANRRD
jgi:predicted metal-dependent phosphoesterase TrpH